MKILFIFIGLSIINVVFSTVRSIATIKSGKLVASLLNGGYFAFYNIMLIWTVADFPLWQKCIITFVCNVLGVFIVKLLEEKMQKDKLWKIETTVNSKYTEAIDELLNRANISHNYISIGNDQVIFNIFCLTQKQSCAVSEILKQFNAKYFAAESKTL